ncbi:unnamed protein product [Durusdinium trenchii]|uniref:Arylamine N-acetyltransferase n=1 Tax=Durusdinium trenchii TaxID=1381693 RepID=A0ABP0L510_9DINO
MAAMALPPSYQRVHDVKLSKSQVKRLRKRCLLDECEEAAGPDLLFKVHRGLFSALPFENLTALREDWVSLDIADIIDKMCGPDGSSRRGGYCFELNKLLAVFLLHLGFQVQPFAARVWLDDGETPRLPTPPLHTHMCLLVNAGTTGPPYLCDVAFGKVGLFEPISLEKLNQGVLQNGHTRMRLESSSFKTLQGLDYDTYMLWVEIDGKWMRGYSILPVQDLSYVDSIPLNLKVYGYFESPFTQRLWCERRDREHIRILGSHFLREAAGSCQKFSIESGKHLQQLLRSHFDLELSLAECEGLHRLGEAEPGEEKWRCLLELRQRDADRFKRFHFPVAVAAGVVILVVMWRAFQRR